nr:hypothetical protein [Roseburia hominis]
MRHIVADAKTRPIGEIIRQTAQQLRLFIKHIFQIDSQSGILCEQTAPVGTAFFEPSFPVAFQTEIGNVVRVKNDSAHAKAHGNVHTLPDADIGGVEDQRVLAVDADVRKGSV